MWPINRLMRVRSLFVLIAALSIGTSVHAPAAAQTAVQPVTPTTVAVPIFKQIGQIGKGSVESVGWIVGSDHVEIHVGSQLLYLDSHLTPLGTLDLTGKVITAVDHNDTYTALGFEDGTVRLYTIADRSLYATLTGHTARINTIAFSADGAKLITGSDDDTARIWSIASRSLLQTLTGAATSVSSVSFESATSSDQTRVVTYSSENGDVRVWNAESGALYTLVSRPSSTWKVQTWDSTLRYVVTNVASSTGYQLTLTETLTGLQTTITTGFSQPPTIARFSPDGQKLFLASVFSGEALVLDTTTQAVIKKITVSPDKLNVYHFSEDGTQLVLGLANGSVVLESLATGQEALFSPFSTAISEVVFNHTGDRLFIYSTGGKIVVLDTAGKPVGMLDNGADVSTFDYATKSPVIVTGNSTGELITWDAVTLTKLGALSGFSTFTYPLIWSPDGKQLAGVGTDNTIHIWDATTDQAIRQLMGHTLTINALAWSPDGKLIASASSDRTVRLWDAATGLELHKITFVDRAYAVAFSPDSQRLAVGSRETNRQLSLFALDGTELYSFTNLVQTVIQIAWRPNDPTRLMAGESNGTLLVVDLTNMTQVQVQQTVTANSEIGNIAWAPDGAQVVTVSYDHTLRLWSFANGLTLRHREKTAGPVFSVSWNKTTNLIAMNYGDLIRLIDPSGTEITTIAGHTSYAYSVAWSPDGTRLASSSYDGTIRLWQAQ